MGDTVKGSAAVELAELEKMVEGVIGENGESRLRPICSTGVPALDAALGGGIFPGITVLAGMPGAGKTTLATQVWCTAMKAGGVVACYLDLETGGGPVAAKALCVLSGGRVRLDQLSTLDKLDGEQRQSLMDAVEFMEREYAHEIPDSGRHVYTLDDLNWRPELGLIKWTRNGPDPDEDWWSDYGEMARADVGAIWHVLDDMEDAEGLDRLLVVDYAQLLRCTTYPQEPTRRLEAAIEDVQQMVSDTPERCAVVLISSLSRTGYAKPWEFASTFGSSAVEYSAEAVVTLADAKPDEVEALGLNEKQREWLDKQQGAKVVNAYVSKNRHGCQNTVVPLAFEPLRARFKGVRNH